MNIIQQLEPIVYKDSESKVCLEVAVLRRGFKPNYFGNYSLTCNSSLLTPNF